MNINKMRIFLLFTGILSRDNLFDASATQQQKTTIAPIQPKSIVPLQQTKKDKPEITETFNKYSKYMQQAEEIEQVSKEAVRDIAFFRNSNAFTNIFNKEVFQYTLFNDSITIYMPVLLSNEGVTLIHQFAMNLNFTQINSNEGFKKSLVNFEKAIKGVIPEEKKLKSCSFNNKVEINTKCLNNFMQLLSAYACEAINDTILAEGRVRFNNKGKSYNLLHGSENILNYAHHIFGQLEIQYNFDPAFILNNVFHTEKETFVREWFDTIDFATLSVNNTNPVNIQKNLQHFFSGFIFPLQYLIQESSIALDKSISTFIIKNSGQDTFGNHFITKLQQVVQGYFFKLNYIIHSTSFQESVTTNQIETSAMFYTLTLLNKKFPMQFTTWSDTHTTKNSTITDFGNVMYYLSELKNSLQRPNMRENIETFMKSLTGKSFILNLESLTPKIDFLGTLDASLLELQALFKLNITLNGNQITFNLNDKTNCPIVITNLTDMGNIEKGSKGMGAFVFAREEDVISDVVRQHRAAQIELEKNKGLLEKIKNLPNFIVNSISSKGKVKNIEQPNIIQLPGMNNVKPQKSNTEVNNFQPEKATFLGNILNKIFKVEFFNHSNDILLKTQNTEILAHFNHNPFANMFLELSINTIVKTTDGEVSAPFIELIASMPSLKSVIFDQPDLNSSTAIIAAIASPLNSLKIGAIDENIIKKLIEDYHVYNKTTETPNNTLTQIEASFVLGCNYKLIVDLTLNVLIDLSFRSIANGNESFIAITLPAFKLNSIKEEMSRIKKDLCIENFAKMEKGETTLYIDVKEVNANLLKPAEKQQILTPYGQIEINYYSTASLLKK